MVNRAKQKGTGWESAIVTWLKENGVPYAERRTLSGSKDRGDIAGIPGVVIEAKSCAKIELSKWMDEARTEQANDRAAVAVVWTKRRGKTSPGAGFVIMEGDQLLQLLVAAGYIQGGPSDG